MHVSLQWWNYQHEQHDCDKLKKSGRSFLSFRSMKQEPIPAQSEMKRSFPRLFL